MNKIDQLEDQLKKLAKRLKKRVQTLENKYQKAFESQALYMGNGIYMLAGLYSTDTRELKLMFILQQEGVKVNDKHDPVGDEQ